MVLADLGAIKNLPAAEEGQGFGRDAENTRYAGEITRDAAWRPGCAPLLFGFGDSLLLPGGLDHRSSGRDGRQWRRGHLGLADLLDALVHRSTEERGADRSRGELCDLVRSFHHLPGEGYNASYHAVYSGFEDL